MSDWRTDVKYLVHQSKIKVPYTWSVGDTGSRFLRALRDDKKILANKCPKTGQIFCPPKLNSPYSLEPITEWVELPGTGTVTTFTERSYDSLAAAADAPRIYALIQLDASSPLPKRETENGRSTGGAIQALPHLLGEVDFKSVKIGLRVEPVFKETREGHILDIAYFRPISANK